MIERRASDSANVPALVRAFAAQIRSGRLERFSASRFLRGSPCSSRSRVELGLPVHFGSLLFFPACRGLRRLSKLFPDIEVTSFRSDAGSASSGGRCASSAPLEEAKV